MEVMNWPELSVVEPESVPSRISVVLVEEAKVGGTQCSGCPRVDQDLRLLARVAKPASMTVCEDSYISPCVEGTLSSSDLAGIPFAVGPVGHIGPCGTLSPSDFKSVGLDGPYGTLSPSDSVSVGPDGLYGTLSPSALVAVGPVGPYGTLSPSDSESVGPDGPYGTLSPSVYESVGPDGLDIPYGTLSPFANIAVALLAYIGRCPRLILNLLALLARVGRCPRLILLQ